MIHLLHGDQTTSSRNKLIQLINLHQQQGREVTRLLAKDLTVAELEHHLGATSLFGQTPLIVIEELHSLPTSQRKKELINLIAQHRGELILWEKRLLTPTMIKKLGQPQVQEFKTSSAIFKWLDLISPKANKKTLIDALHQAIEQDGDHYCLMMLTRQIRLLITAAENQPIAGPPFVQQKLIRQAQSFTLQQLLTLHHKLLDIDLASKSSSSLTLTQQLDLLMLAV